jgi:hypothetical protein
LPLKDCANITIRAANNALQYEGCGSLTLNPCSCAFILISGMGSYKKGWEAVKMALHTPESTSFHPDI